MAEPREIGPGGAIPYGARVSGRDIENYGGSDPAGWLTRLGRGVLQAALAADGLQYVVPQVTDRIMAPDGGVDASLSIEVELPGPRQPGLVNPGRTVYQFKWRSKREAIFRAAAGELKKLQDHAALPDSYVFVTNVDLTLDDHERVRDELLKGCPERRRERVVILGASELADRINSDPRLRVAHFDVALGLCTLELARDFAERRYGNEGVASALFNREEEVAAIQRFLRDPVRKALVVYGPHGVGKTRVVLEALALIPEQMVWAREIPPQPAGLIQVLDESPYPPVLVIDDVEEAPDALLRRALEATRLKTILISPWSVRAPGAVNLPIKPLGSTEGEKFLGQIFPRMPFSHRSWLFDQFGGLPGVLVQGAVALQSGIKPDPLEEPRYEDILDSYESRMTRGLAPAMGALEVLSVFPRFRIGRRASPDLEALCDVLGVDIGKVLASLEMLKARNLVEQAGFREDGTFQVTPPLLARRVARRVLQGIGPRLVVLFGRLSPEGQARLTRRVAELRSEPALRDFLSWLFSRDGLFADIETLSTHAGSVHSLAETIPGPTARELRRVLEEGAIVERRTTLAGQTRREIVYALESLVYRQDTFEDGAKGLLCMAEAENENYGNNATGVFTEIFHWKHPQIPKDGRLRARLLASLVDPQSPPRRVIVAKAAAQSLETHFAVRLWQGEGVAPAEPAWRPTVWGEAWDAVRPVVNLLKQLATDPEAGVRREAVYGLSRGVGGVLEVGLVEEAIEGLEFLSNLPPDADERARLAEAVAFLVSDLRKRVAAVQDVEFRTVVQRALERGEALFERLTSGDFSARFMHWLGQAPMRARRRMGEPANHEDIVRQGERLAQEVNADPSRFGVDLQDWITSGQASNGGYFLFPLGQLDSGKAWLGALEARIERPGGVNAVGIYVAGWFTKAPDEVEAYLDAIASRGGRWSEAAVDATSRIGGSMRGVRRLLLCVTQGDVDRVRVARQLPWGRWDKPLATDGFLDLITGLRDGSADVDWALLEFLDHRWSSRSDERERVGPVAVELLRNTAGEPSRQHDPYDWDSLAAAVVDWNIDLGFELLLAHLQVGPGGQGVFLAHHRKQLIEGLSSQDRPRLVRMLLQAALESPEKWRIEMELAHLLRPQTDAEELLRFAEEHGVEVARLIAENLDAAQPGFWEMMPAFIARWGYDPEVREGIIHSVTWIRGVYSGKADTLSPRVEPLDKLSGHTDPLVREIARQAKTALLEEMRVENW